MIRMTEGELAELFPKATRAAAGPRRRRERPPERIALDSEIPLASLRLLAVDQGSKDCGAAFFTGDDVAWTQLFAPPDAWSWDRRMQWIGDRLREHLGRSEPPQLVAIEGVAFGINARTTITMSEQRGWLRCLFAHWYPGVLQVTVSPSTVRAAHEAGRRREEAKTRFMQVAAFKLGGAKVSQDEADAIAIGLAAIDRLKRERLLARAT